MSTDGDPGIPESVSLLNCLESATPRALTLATSWSGDRGSLKSGLGPPGPWTMLRQAGEGPWKRDDNPTMRGKRSLDTQDMWVIL